MNLPPLLRRRLDDARLWARRHADAISAGWLIVGVALLLSAAVMPDGRDGLLFFGSLVALDGLSMLVERRAPQFQTPYRRTLVALGVVGMGAYIWLGWDILQGPSLVLLVTGWMPLRGGKPGPERHNRADARQWARLEEVREREERLRRERPGDRIQVPWADDPAGSR